MYLSNRDIRWAIDRGTLIVDPRPEALGAGYDETAIDLHLDNRQSWAIPFRAGRKRGDRAVDRRDNFQSARHRPQEGGVVDGRAKSRHRGAVEPK